MLTEMTRTDGSLITAVPTTDFGYWLRDRCLERNWETYRQAAEYTGVSHAQIRSYVVEKAHPRPPTTRRLAKALKVDERELFRIVAMSEVIAGGGPAPAGDLPRHPRDFGIDRGVRPAAAPSGPPKATILLYRPDGEVDALTARNEREELSIRRVVDAIDAWRAAERGEGDAGGGESRTGDPS